jgi:hypothetical protein
MVPENCAQQAMAASLPSVAWASPHRAQNMKRARRRPWLDVVRHFYLIFFNLFINN